MKKKNLTVEQIEIVKKLGVVPYFVLTKKGKKLYTLSESVEHILEKFKGLREYREITWEVFLENREIS